MASQRKSSTPQPVKRRSWWQRLWNQRDNQRIQPVAVPQKEPAAINLPEEPTTQELEEKPKSNVWSVFLRLGAVVCGAAVIAAGGYGVYTILYHSSHFTVQKIRFVNEKPLLYVTEQALLERANVALGKNLLEVSLAQMEQSLAQEPMIKHVHVYREWPHTLLLDVAEYEPRLVIELGGWYLADENGVVFKRATEQEARRYPKLMGVQRATYQDKRAEVQEWIRRGIAISKIYQQTLTSMRPRLLEIHPKIFRSDHSMDVLLKTETTEIWIPWGSITMLEQKMKYLDGLQVNLPTTKKQPAVIFLNNRTDPERVTVGPRDASLDES